MAGHKRILIFHNRDVVAVINGNCDVNPELEAELVEDRDVRTSTMKALREHVTSHQC